jgi:hypothetical protein
MPEGFRVRINRKFADFLDGVDLTRIGTGEEVVLPAREALILIAEGWAEPVTEPIAAADDKPPRRRRSTKRPAK